MLLAAAMVAAILAPLLGGVWLPALGVMDEGGGAGAGQAYQVEPPPTPCRQEARVLFGGYRFSAECAGQAPSFDHRLYVVRNAGRQAGVGLVRGMDGASLDDLATLDGAPFTIFWSPNAHRFFANQQQANGLDRLRLFAVREERLGEMPALGEAAAQVLREMRPCMAAEDIGVSGVRWGADGRRLALLVYSRKAACSGTGGWRPLWMIGDALTGAIEPESIRARRARERVPEDGPYATL